MLFHLQRLRDISRNKSAELTQLYSQVHGLGQHNAELVLKNIDANTKMTDLGARQQALEEELARTAGERDAQRAVVDGELGRRSSRRRPSSSARRQSSKARRPSSNARRRPSPRSPRPSLRGIPPLLSRRRPLGAWRLPSRRRRTPCPRSKGPSESSRRKRRRISWVSARDFAVIGF